MEFFKKRKILTLFIIVFSLALFLSITIVLQRIYYNWQRKRFLSQQAKLKQAQMEKRERDFQNLLLRQAKSVSKTGGDKENINKTKAIGQYSLHIIFVKHKTLSNNKIVPLVNELKRNDRDLFRDCSTISPCTLNASLNYINTYFANEGRKYGIDNFQLNIVTHGIYTLPSLIKVGDFANFWGKDPFDIIKLQDSFEQIIKQNNIAVAENDYVVFLYFDDSFELPAEADKKRFYEFKKFRSFADYNKGRIYLNIYDFSPLFSKNVTATIIHEVLHLFGAIDKYNEYDNNRICDKKGYGDPDKKPLIPQKTADIMCLYVEYADGKFSRGDIIDHNLVINRITAKEIGWINN